MNENLRTMLIRHEGYRLIPYLCTAGFQTIGVGHNCDANPLPEDIHLQMSLYGFISEGMVEQLLEMDVEIAEKSCRKLYPAFDEFTQDRQDALIDLMFNMGERGLKAFKNTNKAINEGRWVDAANGIRKSLYWKQLGGDPPGTDDGKLERPEEIARMIEVG
jgi:lysozyme